MLQLRKLHARLAHIIWRALHGHAHYGVIRASFLRRARVYGSITGDWMLLAELGLMGKIMEVPEVLFRLRIHPANTWNATSTPREILKLLNPAANGLETVLPFRIAVILEYLKSVGHSALPLHEKIMCLAVAGITPALRNLWLWSLKASGPTRKHLRQLTGYRALCPSADAD